MGLAFYLHIEGKDAVLRNLGWWLISTEQAVTVLGSAMRTHGVYESFQVKQNGYKPMFSFVMDLKDKTWKGEYVDMSITYFNTCIFNTLFYSFSHF